MSSESYILDLGLNNTCYITGLFTTCLLFILSTTVRRKQPNDGTIDIRLVIAIIIMVL